MLKLNSRSQTFMAQQKCNAFQILGKTHKKIYGHRLKVYGLLEKFTVLDVNDRSSQDSRYGKYRVSYGPKGHVRSI